MSTEPYPYDRRHLTRYSFVSKGKRGAIVKIVEFSPTSNKQIINMGFGDLMPDGSIDDESNSNNNDLVKVMATMISIIKDFTNQYPSYKIVFTGSSQKRNILYQRILRNYYIEFSRDFTITALEPTANGHYQEVPFDMENKNYYAFFIKRK